VQRTTPFRSAPALLFITAVAFAASGATAATHAIHKCTDADGKTIFSDAPCPNGSGQDAAPEPATPAASPAPAQPAAAAVAQTSEAADPSDCSSWTPPEGDVTVDQPRKVDREALPRDRSGNPVEIFVSKRSANTVAAACSAMVSACSHKSDDPGKSIDACFKSAPRCTSDRPWEQDTACCPQACWQKYVDLRRKCVDASTASYRALFQEHCVSTAAELSTQPKTP
jgi:hypothetical protein